MAISSQQAMALSPSLLGKGLLKPDLKALPTVLLDPGLTIVTLDNIKRGVRLRPIATRKIF